MKIEETTGCTAFNLTFDGKPLSEYNETDQNYIIDYLLQKVKDGINDHTIDILSLIKCFQYDDFYSENMICDQCGDDVTHTIWNI